MFLYFELLHIRFWCLIISSSRLLHVHTQRKWILLLEKTANFGKSFSVVGNSWFAFKFAVQFDYSSSVKDGNIIIIGIINTSSVTACCIVGNVLLSKLSKLRTPFLLFPTDGNIFLVANSLKRRHLGKFA